MSKILCTGGAGFFGSWVVDRLIGQDKNVVIIDDLSSGFKENINPLAIFEEGSICDKMFVEEVFHKHGPFDKIFHCAAQVSLRHSLINPQKDAEINILGSINIIQAALMNSGIHKHLVEFAFVSTGGAIYSSKAGLPWDVKSPVGPKSCYGHTKLCVEGYLRILGGKNKYFDYRIFRPGNLYGPKQSGSKECGVIAIFFDSILQGKPLQVYGDGSTTRDFVFISDATDYLVQDFSELDYNLYNIYNIGSGKEVSINTIIKYLREMGLRFEVEYHKAIPGELKRTCLVSTVKNRWTTWKPDVEFKNGLEKTWQYHLDQGKR